MSDTDSENLKGGPFAVPRHRLSSADITGPDKIAVLRELYGRELMRSELIPTSQDGHVAFDVSVAALGDLAWARCRASNLDFARTPQLVKDAADDLFLSTTSEGYAVRTGERELDVAAGGGVLTATSQTFRVFNPRSTVTAGIYIPRARLALLLPRLGEAPLIALPAGAPGLDLVFGYARLIAESADMTPELLQMTTTHLVELLATVIDPQRETGGDADPRGVAGARLDAIRRDIRANIARPGLALERFARLHGVTPRYVQRLFEREGDSFSDFVRRERLEQARRMLCDPAHRHKRILVIALECGFGDITTFNRAFRRAFGHTPSDMRRQKDG